MYITGNALRERIQKEEMITEVSLDQIGNISYDLRIKGIIVPETKKDGNNEPLLQYNLAPQETIFVSTTETLRLPENMFATIIPRNSCIRQGLDIEAPVYQPGHKTRIFIRVRNISDDVITLRQGIGIASIMFYELNENVTPYSGAYTDEFDYKGVGDFHSVPVPGMKKINKKIESLRDMEKGIYGTVITIMTIFISIFSLINLNANFLHAMDSTKALVAFNLTTIGAVFALVGLAVGVLISRTEEDQKRASQRMYVIFLFAVVLIVAAIVLSLM